MGGALACGLTHMAVTPLDVVKCNIQVDPKKYGGIAQGFGIVYKEQGLAGIVRGWFPTLIGYGAQGAFKFGLYEYFKKWVYGLPTILVSLGRWHAAAHNCAALCRPVLAAHCKGT